MSRYVDVDYVNKIIGTALENVKDENEISESFYNGAKYVLDYINEMADERSENEV